MDDTPVLLVRNVLGFHQDEDGSHASIGFEGADGMTFGLAFTPESLCSLFSAVVNALGQWPVRRMQDRPFCAIEPKKIEVGQEGAEHYSLSFQLDHQGCVHFYLDEDSAGRLLKLLAAAVRAAPVTSH